jgi:uncharacterized protein
MRLFSALLFLPLLCLSGITLAAEGDVQPIPALTAPVTDQAQLLNPADTSALNQKLSAFSAAKGSQIAVLIVPTTAPEDIFSYGFRVADHWKLGRKGVDDGVLLVVAVQDRKTNLQIGYGLEGAIPDARSKQVIDDIITPYFRKGDFAGGLNAGTDALIKLINGEQLPALPTHAQRGAKNGSNNSMMLAIIIGVVVGFIVKSLLGNVAGGLAGGGIALTIALLLGAVLGVAIFGAIFAAVIASSNGGRGLGGFGGGGFGGGLGGGSFGGGGGFSGGGGGFGGGGASGSW